MKASVVVPSGWALEDQTRWFLKFYGGTLSKVLKSTEVQDAHPGVLGCRS